MTQSIRNIVFVFPAAVLAMIPKDVIGWHHAIGYYLTKAHCRSIGLLMDRVFVSMTVLLFATGSVRADEIQTFVDTSCLDCHSGDSADAGLDLASQRFDITEPAKRDLWVKVHDRVERGEMPPPDYDQPPASTKHAFLKGLSRKILLAEQERYKHEGRTVFRRLNRTEYENTLRDSLNLPHLDVRDQLPPDQAAGGFDNQAEVLELSFVHIARYLAAAEVALDEAMKQGPPPETKKWLVRPADLMQINRGVEIGDARGVFRQTNSAQTPYEISRVKPHADGVYRIRIEAFGFHWNQGQVENGREEQVLSIYASPRKSVSRLLHSQSLTSDVNARTPVEFDAFIRSGEKIILYFSTLTTANRPRKIPLDTIEAPGVGIGQIDIEGPLPASDRHTRGNSLFIIGDLPEPQNVKEMLTRFMQRVCRHQIDESLVDKHAEIVQQGLSHGATPEAALRAGYKSILCSPSFLFFHERPGQLSGDALAARLSYFLWKGPPDVELSAAGRRGELSTPDGITHHVGRMLNDKRFERMVEDIAAQWFDLSRIDFTQPDERLYPEFDVYLKESMIAETHATLRRMFRENRPVRELVDSDEVFLNRRLATHYGIEGVTDSDLKLVTLPKSSPRGGVLTQGAILTVTANGTNTSPVMRGAWVLDRILGTPPSPPPANVPAIEPDIKGATTMRQQLAQHRDNDACRSCHATIDPPGFALENYDVMGAWRDRYRSLGKGQPVRELIRGHKPQFRLAMEVDAGGQTSSGDSFKDIYDFKQILLQNERQIARNAVERLVAYSTGTAVGFADRAEVESILDKHEAEGFGLRDLVISIVSSNTFQRK